MLAGYVPYTLLVLISLFALKYRKIQAKPREWWGQLKAYIRTMDDARLFSLLSIVIIFVFYCIPKSKRSVYLLPIYPFIAYFLAEYILYLVRVRPVVMKVFGSVMASLSVLLLFVFFSLRMGWVPDSIFSGRHAEENRAFMHALETVPLGVVSWFLIGAMLVAVKCFVSALRKKELSMIHYDVFFIVFTIFLSLDGLFQPPVLNVKSQKPIAERIASVVPQGTVYSYQLNEVKGNPLRQFIVNFYLGDRVVPFYAVSPAQGYMVAEEGEMAVFKEEHPDYQVREIPIGDYRLRLYQFKKDTE